MADNNQELIKVLRDLASTCRDAEEGYNKAAKGAHSDELRTKFDQLSVERVEFAAEYDRLVEQYGGEKGQTGHGGGVLRKGWADLEQGIRPREDHELSTFAADGEQGGLRHFERALELGTLPDDVRAVVRRHHAKISAAVDSLRTVRV
jgi:uncharacterized protein (TIGR02284 family)